MARSRSSQQRRSQKGSRRPPNKPRADRVQLLIAGVFVISTLISARLFIVQIMEHDFYTAHASGQYELVKELIAERGAIYAHDRFADDGLAVIATNQTVHQVYTNPRQITNAEATAQLLANTLGLDYDIMLSRVSKPDDVYEPIKDQVTDQEISQLEQQLGEQQLEGIHWLPEEARYYPEDGAVAAVTGFLGYTDDGRKGQYGLEGYFDQELSGTEGSLSFERDASGGIIVAADKDVTPAQDGDLLVTTIDHNIQRRAATLIAAAVDAWKAERGTVIVMDPSSGAILAMADAPQYNPNDYGNVDEPSVYLNHGVSDQYEPGSVMKPITMAAAINEGQITPYTTYDDTGSVKIAGYDISNFDERGRGVVDMITVLQQSLNTGAIFAVQKIGNERWYDYVQRFGFGKRIGIQMSGENPGDISSIGKIADVYTATSSFGHGFTATPLQMVQAYGALANGGTMMKPYIIDQIVSPNGHQAVTKPEAVGQPVSAETARTVAAMLVSVVDQGYDDKAQLSRYFLAGKTGTALLPKANGVGYDTSQSIHTFMGFGPVSDPKFVVLIKLDRPQGAQYSSTTTAPIFSDLAQYMLNYLQIQPDRPE